MYPKTPGCFSDLSAALYYKSYCFFLKLLIVLPVHFPLLHFTPPKVLRFYYNLTFRCVRYFGGSAYPDARTPSEMFPNEMAGKPFPILKEIKGKEINGDKGKPVNLLIEGDNYHSLAVLNFTHQEAIDMIYIDPPYNRGVKGGNDFRYNDKFVDSEDPFRHSKWLSFMEKRLKLAKNLLKPTGAIFISIDNTEQAPLRLLCDEIFNDKNFVGVLIWRKKKGGGQA